MQFEGMIYEICSDMFVYILDLIPAEELLSFCRVFNVHNV